MLSSTILQYSCKCCNHELFELSLMHMLDKRGNATDKGPVMRHSS